jgi:hypothetical protein
VTEFLTIRHQVNEVELIQTRLTDNSEKVRKTS